ncbi:MAG: hypothetical protein FJ050_00295 [Cyanobacteria bacterium M_surface_7_m2_040]|nr:hypothetical protein [Cyanobacteria bacterium M_surface_7_m2_040]
MIRPARWDIARIRRRHAGYRYLLALELLILALQPVCRLWPPLNSLLAMALALLILSTLTRFSMLRATRRRAMVVGVAAIALELVWLLLGLLGLASSFWFTLVHLLVWLVYLGMTILRMVKSLIQEPYVTFSVVMGAASGYLLIGYSGGLLLFSIWLLNPASFGLLKSVSGGSSDVLQLLAAGPSMFLGAFGYLTTAGTNLIQARSLVAEAATTLITVAGQLYVAILIALVLARYHRRRN